MKKVTITRADREEYTNAKKVDQEAKDKNKENK